MKRKKNGFWILLLGFFLIVVGIFIAFIVRDEQSKKFQSLLSKEYDIKVSYGIIEREKVLKEKNALFKRVFQDNETYLVITKDNIVFSYYLDWYYTFDPMKGYKLDYKKEITNETKEKILKAINDIAVDNLNSKIKAEYVDVSINGTNKFIKKIDLQYILQDNDILLGI